MNRPAFLTPEGSLRKFDIITANPMWSQNFSPSTYENDHYNRLIFGYPPSSSADWGWIQHMFASLNKKGKMAVVIDTAILDRVLRHAHIFNMKEDSYKLCEYMQTEEKRVMPVS